MALNWVMFDAIHNPVPLQGEINITTVSDVECTLVIPDVSPQTSSAGAGASGPSRMKECGTIHLTDKRLIFTSQPSGSKAKLAFESLTLPLECILSSKFEQPFFGSNFLVLSINPSPGGGLTHGTTLEARTLKTGLFSFVGILEKTRERAVYMKRHSMDDDENLPAYTSPSSMPAASSSNYDMPPGYEA
ncbi:hypothetical protein SCLCIDRAFT_1214089 [Scleroderma citrinum Foug A]|uniref:GRAM domain-containing protein n=1 Tax=Scleroderma citrinum Foug A TaxID=1036808 RepID=A0A0C2ZQ72_9AGAM|nr:hypothetical protein SCLCIDRAFT_1214089 [Scleroderma citrinum Foug A]